MRDALARVLVRTDSFDPVVLEAPPPLATELVERLAGLDRAVTSDTVDRVVPLDPTESPPSHWAVGRRRGDDTLWWLVPAEALDALGGTAAWLWAAPDEDTVAAEPLRQVLARLDGFARPSAAADVLGRVVGHLHAREPVAIIVPHEYLAADPMAARLLALAALLTLPEARRNEVRVSVGEHAPSVAAYDLVVTSASPPGFALVYLARPEPVTGLIPFFVANRLRADDPEGLEAVARTFASGPDRWFDGIAAMVREGLPGLSDLPPALVTDDPRAAAAMLAARFAAGSPLTTELTATLVEVTARTWDRAPWRALFAHHAGPARAQAIQALVNGGSVPPTDWLVEVGPLVGDGGAADEWARGLVSWLDLREDVEPIAVAMEQLLMRHERTTLRVWQCGQLLEQLLEAGHVEAASRLWSGPLLRAIVEEGQANELFAESPGEAPSNDRAHRLVTPLTLPDPDEAVERDRARTVAALIRTAHEAPGLAAALCERWALRPRGPLRDDPVWAERPDLRPTRREPARTNAPAPSARQDEAPPEPPVRPPPGIAPPALPHETEELRRLLEAVAATPGGSPDRGLVLARDAVAHTAFPDPALASAAEGVAARKGAPPIWGLLTVAASPPETWDDETVDATVVAYCGGRQDPESAAIARECMARLGAAPQWDPLDIARWIVRIALAPRAAGNRTLVIALLQGVRSRQHDAVAFLAQVLSAMFDLPPDHDGSRMLVEALAPAGWSGARLEEVIDQVGPMNIPLSFRRTLVSIAEV